ncbi:MAG: SET domain-containing protein-lysine N-methyltransferase [Pirellulales bacterium]
MPTVPIDSDTPHHSYDLNAYSPTTSKPYYSTSITSFIRIGETSVGKGVFARRHIHEGLLLSEIHGKVLEDYPEDSSYCMALPSGKLLEPTAPLRFLNHSCDPNCELFYWEDEETNLQEDRLWLQTIRPIVPGEQLLIDYCWPADAAIPCRCGAPTCRGWIVDPDEFHLLPTQETGDDGVSLQSY